MTNEELALKIQQVKEVVDKQAEITAKLQKSFDELTGARRLLVWLCGLVAAISVPVIMLWAAHKK